MSEKPNLIVDLTFNFSLRIISLQKYWSQKENSILQISYSEVGHQLEPMLEKHKEQKVR
jgi:hypothetical protein